MDKYLIELKQIKKKSDVANSLAMAPATFLFMLGYFLGAKDLPPFMYFVIAGMSFFFIYWFYAYLTKHIAKCPSCKKNYFSIKDSLLRIITFKFGSIREVSCNHCGLALKEPSKAKRNTNK